MNNPATAKSIPGQNVPKGRSSPAKGSKDRNSQRNLRKLRLLVGATQLQVAEKAGVTERCLRKVEQGKVRAQRGTLAAIEGAIAILGRTAQAAALLLLLVLCSSGCNMAHAATGLQLVSVSCMAVLVAISSKAKPELAGSITTLCSSDAQRATTTPPKATCCHGAHRCAPSSKAATHKEQHEHEQHDTTQVC